MGLFFYNKIGSIISIGDLPTTNIIEPTFREVFFGSFVSFVLFFDNGVIFRLFHRFIRVGKSH